MPESSKHPVQLGAQQEFQDKSVLITGGTGSFGKEFIRLLLDHHEPRKVIVFSRDELKQHEMQANLGFTDDRLRFFLGDIRDANRLRRAMRGVDTVVHAAALKQVPACEYNPIEAVRTNINGAENIIDAALDNKVEKVLALSTDKAVSPVNLYGATKLVMEKLFVQANSYAGGEGTRFSCVRYGNVIGSRGSVVPLFMVQRKSGTLTITDERMTRFWITLQQGTRFVADRIAEMRGGEVFVPKVPSVDIMTLAKAVAPECDVSIIGIRPGEKLHEVLLGADESRNARDCNDHYVILPHHPWWAKGGEWDSNPDETPVPDGFVYASDTNEQWLTADQVRDLVEQHVAAVA